MPQGKVKGLRPRYHLYESWQPGRFWLNLLDADFWKCYVHARFMTPPDNRGSITLFGDDPQSHHAYGHHIVSEQLVTEFVEDKGELTHWKKLSKNNHWLDATYQAAAAAGQFGVRLLRPQPQPAAPPSPPRQRKPSRFDNLKIRKFNRC